jgi:uncharacterized 2Fe-2S/4Fe-4S cluster protein (DUF4445 family)
MSGGGELEIEVISADDQGETADDALIVFTPSGKRGRFAVGTPVLDAARELGVGVDSVCGGRGICGRCQVAPGSGRFAKFAITSAADHLTPFSLVEERYARKRGLEPGRRLSCAARIAGDAVIDVPPESLLHRQIVRKRAEARAIEIDPVVRLHYVEVTIPTIEDQRSDLDRLYQALEAQWGLSGLTSGIGTLRALPGVLREGDWKVTVAVRDGARMVGLWPGFRDQAYGLAVDVGTTTIAAHLCDLASGDVVASGGAMNPQIRFGEDLMSRVSYIQLNPDQGGELTAAVRQALGELIAETAAEAGIETGDMVEATVVGNPIMHHILLGIDPRQLGSAPFPLAVDTAVNVDAAALDLALQADAQVYVLPCIAGHVGADTAGMLLSEAPHESDAMTLLVDIGTNAEIVLGNRDRLLACSSPTGPAFEGAQISGGQRAAVGAIERVRIDRGTLEPRFKVIGCDLWSDDPGFAEAVESVGVTGVCGSGIIEAVAELVLSGVVAANGRIEGGRAADTPRLLPHGRTHAYRLHDGPPELLITQADIRAIQLAKGALYAGARLLMDRLGVETPDRIVLAGAFGSVIDPLYAMALGMIPDCDPAHVSSAGNAAGTGARIALLSRRARAEIEDLVRRVEKIETATEADFQDYFVAAMAIPHSRHPFPNAARALAFSAGKTP